ncbi:MAG: hypothetical protein K9W46_03500 [Candidatus Heimdallarchaeum endolithica]|uniref:DAGKc domain-containing protein n=1 Tax=Candidatus Heimdallarchaeum endolithica TaxID=2876572 RepID=A0A9Y1BTT4_9ARCH|nr:MAG: hypothetical protein K9W46_03500 [Candidatus Heimdallarchaeum endolithica]
MGDKYKFIVNPNAGLGKCINKWEIAEKIINEYSIDYAVDFTSGPFQAEDLVIKAVNEGFNKIISVSGDGVLNEITNGLMKVPEEKRKTVSLGVLPFGTGNDYNTVLGFPWNPKNAIVHLMEKSATSPVSIGKMKVVDTGLEKYFINVLDVGISSIVGHAANLGEGSFVKGPRKYTYLALKKLLMVKQIKANIRLDEKEFLPIKLMMVTIGTGKCNGGGMFCCVDAHPQHDRFNVFITKSVNKLQTLIGIGRIKDGKHKTMKGTLFTYAKKVEIKTEKPIAFQFDGEVYIPPKYPQSSVGTHMITEIIPQALKVIYNTEHKSMNWLNQEELLKGKLPPLEEKRDWTHKKYRKWLELN